jgi:hypothetical protein
MDGLALFRRSVMAQEFRPGEIVPQSGIYTITHDARACGHAARGDGDQGPAFPDPAGIARASASSSPMLQSMLARSIISKRRMRRRSNSPFTAWRGR